MICLGGSHVCGQFGCVLWHSCGNSVHKPCLTGDIFCSWIHFGLVSVKSMIPAFPSASRASKIYVCLKLRKLTHQSMGAGVGMAIFGLGAPSV